MQDEDLYAEVCSLTVFCMSAWVLSIFYFTDDVMCTWCILQLYGEAPPEEVAPPSARSEQQAGVPHSAKGTNGIVLSLYSFSA